MQPVPRDPRGFALHETNLRTYVHAGGRDPGVWFFSLEAANSAAVVTARAVFGLPYHRARMRLDKEPNGTLSYASERLWPAPVARHDGRPWDACRDPRGGRARHPRPLSDRALLALYGPSRSSLQWPGSPQPLPCSACRGSLRI